MANCIAIIGYSGLIGGNLYRQYKKKHKNINLYNSKNIDKIDENITYQKVFCAALPAEKWRANKYPKKDKLNLLRLIKNLKKIKTNQFILISTIDVHFNHDYGKNRKYLEEFVKKKFNKYKIIRLPAVFGEGLKKNIIYDLINKNELNKICYNDKFQWYYLKMLKTNIEKVIKSKKNIFEFYSVPINNSEIIKLFNLTYKFSKRLKPIIYNFKPNSGYFFKKNEILKMIKNFLKNYAI